MEHVGKGVSVDLDFHNYNRRVFDALVTDANGKYTTYIIMPASSPASRRCSKAFRGGVPARPLPPNCWEGFVRGANFEKDTYEALCHGLRHIRKYERLLISQHEKGAAGALRRTGALLCGTRVRARIPRLDPRPRNPPRRPVHPRQRPRPGAALLKQAERQQMTPGREFGIISYNDTPLKEILAGGITTLSTDFRQMGLTLAQLIFQKGIRNIENPWMLNIRRSL